MLKALFLDMDETLCDTSGANKKAKVLLAERLQSLYSSDFDAETFANAYLLGIYREWTDAQKERYLPIIASDGEEAFRNQLIADLVAKQGFDAPSLEEASNIQKQFDADRLANFHFYPGIVEFLKEARKAFTLVVITNGPEHSQLPKIDTVQLQDLVDHIIVGGQEPEQKPARSIFEKALKLAGCAAHEAIHVGDSLAADIVGAHNSGITSLWIQHQQPLDAELGINPSHTVLHPSEIPSLIRELHPH